MNRALAATLLLSLYSVRPPAQDHQHAADAEKLGTVHFATSCRPAAQAPFDRAVALLHSFEFGLAIDAFNAALQADPGCAMAEWGIALSQWGNPFAVGARSPAQLQQGRQAIERARAIGPGTQRERRYVEAAAALYASYETTPQSARVVAYRDAMARLSAADAADTEGAIFYALALTASEDINDKTYASRSKAIAILAPLFEKQPDHPGLAHYLIHSNDVPALAPKGLDAARRYASIAPSAPHALHMPSHIFTRVGSWQDSIDTNAASAAAARRVNAASEELHATDYMMYAYLQTAQDAAAKRLVDALPEIIGRFNAGSTAGATAPSSAVFAHAAIPARWALERGAWRDAVGLDAYPSSVPYADALTHFARAIGASRSGNLPAARAAVDELERLRAREAAMNEPYWTDQIAIQRQAAAAWLAFAEGRPQQAVAELRAAADAEDRTEKAAVTPGPLAPARELLADMLLMMNRPADALKEYEATAAKEPNRFRTLVGAMKAASQSGNQALAQTYARTLVTICERADTPARPDLAEARSLASLRTEMLFQKPPGM